MSLSHKAIVRVHYPYHRLDGQEIRRGEISTLLVFAMSVDLKVNAIDRRRGFLGYLKQVSLLPGGGESMGLKRRPAEGNVRNVAAIDNNGRYAITNKNGETVQFEFHTERKLALRIDRDPLGK